MNKYQLYKQIRIELATSCDKEMKAVTELLESGLNSIVGGKVTIELTTSNSLNAMSEAGRIFREELSEATRLILERYRRNLRKEIVGLGLQDLCAEQPAAPPSAPPRPFAAGGEAMANGSERVLQTAEDVMVRSAKMAGA